MACHYILLLSGLYGLKQNLRLMKILSWTECKLDSLFKICSIMKPAGLQEFYYQYYA